MSDLHLLDMNYPPGWDVKYDSKTGKCYYINYLTRAMQLEDPRIRYRQLQNEASTESIPFQTSSQPMHASPYHVYPTNQPPAYQAFHGPNTSSSIHSVSASPLLASKIHQHMEMSPVFRMGSPSISRILNQFERTSIHNNYQETSFMTPSDTDAAVSRINTMFPTACDAHIRLLLKKYHNREAVVISALQVEKHPLTMPGPYSTPPPPRHMLSKKNSLITMTPPLSRFDPTSRTGSPIPMRPGSVASGSCGSSRIETFRSSPKPHSSPKMKLRYLKGIYPKADETLLLDILANADNNLQTASEKLTSMGYEKRDTTTPKPPIRNREDQMLREQKQAEQTEAPPKPKYKSTEEKQKIKAQLQDKYKDVAERIITMALESVDYSEEKAQKILEIVLQNDEKAEKVEEKQEIEEKAAVENDDAADGRDSQKVDEEKSSSSTSSQSSIIAKRDETKSTLAQDDENNSDETLKIQSTDESSPESFTSKLLGVKFFRNRAKAKFNHAKVSPSSQQLDSDGTDIGKENIDSSKKNERKTLAKGPNSGVYRGANEDLLLADYIAWNGANPELCIGKRNFAKGHDSALCSPRVKIAQGANRDLCKGSNASLAKGSIYTQLKLQALADVKCN